MKKFIAVLLALVMCFSLCACATTVNENGEEVAGLGPYIYIGEGEGTEYRLAYHVKTRIVFETWYLGSNYGVIVPYQIYENGAIYGAVYENGEIVPAPYALGVTPEMVESQIGSWFN